jgi:hypothetical protein
MPPWRMSATNGRASALQEPYCRLPPNATLALLPFLSSVSELSRRACIYRTTFYAHADTVVQLLTKVLSSELDEVRQKYMIEQERAGRLLIDHACHSLSDVVDHVIKHEAVYGRASLTPALRAVLAEYFQGSLFLNWTPEDHLACKRKVSGYSAWTLST